jgi:hypothetical protein
MKKRYENGTIWSASDPFSPLGVTYLLREEQEELFVECIFFCLDTIILKNETTNITTWNITCSVGIIVKLTCGNAWSDVLEELGGFSTIFMDDGLVFIDVFSVAQWKSPTRCHVVNNPLFSLCEQVCQHDLAMLLWLSTLIVVGWCRRWYMLGPTANSVAHVKVYYRGVSMRFGLYRFYRYFSC